MHARVRRTRARWVVTVAAAFCAVAHAQTEAPEPKPPTVSEPTLKPSVPSPEAPRPPLRTRSITLPEEAVPPPVDSKSLAAPAPTKPAQPDSAFAIQWHDPQRRIAVHTPRDMRAQGEMYARIVLFVETRGVSKTEVLPLTAMADWFAKNKASPYTVTAGNNLRGNDLARFFNTALIQNEPLSAAEHALLSGLLTASILEPNGKGVRPSEPERILITTPLASQVEGCAACTLTDALRSAILSHEIGHARFFVDALYRDYSLWFWSHGMGETDRAAFLRLLKFRGYDESNRELLANEMQAFLVHTPNAQLFSATMLGMTPGNLQALQDKFVTGLHSLGVSHKEYNPIGTAAAPTRAETPPPNEAALSPK